MLSIRRWGDRRSPSASSCTGPATMPDKAIAIERARSGGGIRPVLLAIAGDSAAGKTTLTRGLVEALGPNLITAICSDDYHRYDRNERRSRTITPLDPDCNYINIMEQHL